MKARTRFAPSPTGFMHVGGVRTALFAWLVARQTKGQFILRLEDTDKVREVAGSDKHIMESLHWLGLDWDEGPDIGGPYAPYRQSERLASYKEWAQKLVDKGRAYADPYSQQELEKLRQKAKDAKKPFLYRDYRPDNPPKWDGTQPLRFKSDPKPYNWHDEVMGELSSAPEAIDDFILIKSDGYPTYNFAHIIDDLNMHCTHVIRSQEFVSSTPRFLNLYEALEIERPKLATLPYVMGPDGKKKLGKRDGAKDILDYRNEGYLPEAMVNFLATLGWNDGTEQEIFSIEELLQKFSLDRVQHSGAKFDDKRLLWMNGVHIRNLPLDDLFEKVRDFWPANSDHDEHPTGRLHDDAYKKQVLALVHERLKFFAELPELTWFFFDEPPVTIDDQVFEDNKQLKKLSVDERRAMLQAVADTLKDSDFTETNLDERMRALVETLQTKTGILFGLVRAAITGSNIAPGLFETMHVLGKPTTLKRLKNLL
jgi:glutamyl-tRNA synthetase